MQIQPLQAQKQDANRKPLASVDRTKSSHLVSEASAGGVENNNPYGSSTTHHGFKESLGGNCATEGERSVDRSNISVVTKAPR